MSISSMPSLVDAVLLGGSSAWGRLSTAVAATFTADLFASSAVSCDATALSTLSSSRLMLMLTRSSLSHSHRAFLLARGAKSQRGRRACLPSQGKLLVMHRQPQGRIALYDKTRVINLPAVYPVDGVFARSCHLIQRFCSTSNIRVEERQCLLIWDDRDTAWSIVILRHHDHQSMTQ